LNKVYDDDDQVEITAGIAVKAPAEVRLLIMNNNNNNNNNTHLRHEAICECSLWGR